MLPGIGWPEAADPPAGVVPREVALGLIRQESSFDPAAGSPSGAQGLMQLMRGTAADVARKLGAAPGPLTDPAVNLRLGTAYLAGLLARFGAVPPALAGYNAGPGRARQWIAKFGDPATGTVDPIDWVELIPFNETRDYVQRVVENIMIYRVRDGVALTHPVLRWAGNGS
jgi:soluble lytic murein transglycosylase